MPQIWMSYGELGLLLKCHPEEARLRAIATGADRKRSRDGLSRVKLPAAWMELFIQQLRGVDRFQQAADEIRLLPHMNLPPVIDEKQEHSEAA